MAGQRSEYDYFPRWGINNTDVSYNIYVFLLPSIDALQEFKVQSGIFPAEFGRATGQINVSTKPGTNAYHVRCSSFTQFQARCAKLYAFTSARPAKAPYKRNQYGFTLGGPVLIPRLFNGKNRLSFMANYEAVRDRLDARSIASVPRPPCVPVTSPVLPIMIPRPARRQPDGSIVAQPFPCNTVPSSQYRPSFYQTPGILSRSQHTRRRTIPQLSEHRRPADRYRPVHRSCRFHRRFEIHLDRPLQLGQRVAAQTYHVPTPGSQARNFPKQVMLSNIRLLSPTAVNEFRFGYDQFINANVNYNAFTRNVVAEIGGLAGVASPFPDIYGIPGVSIAGFSGFGEGSPFIDRNKTFQWIDSISFTRGKHGMRFGGRNPPRSV